MSVADLEARLSQLENLARNEGKSQELKAYITRIESKLDQGDSLTKGELAKLSQELTRLREHSKILANDLVKPMWEERESRLKAEAEAQNKPAKKPGRLFDWLFDYGD